MWRYPYTGSKRPSRRGRQRKKMGRRFALAQRNLQNAVDVTTAQSSARADTLECLLILENQGQRKVDSPLPAYRRRARRKRTHRDEANLPQPAIEILADERVIGKFGIAGADAIDLLQLSGREVLRGVEAPAPRQQALPPQNLVEPCDRACESVAHVQQRAIGVGQRGRAGQDPRRALAAGIAARVDGLQQLDGAARPRSEE